jgi:hypothetical protein
MMVSALVKLGEMIKLEEERKNTKNGKTKKPEYKNGKK